MSRVNAHLDAPGRLIVQSGPSAPCRRLSTIRVEVDRAASAFEPAGRRHLVLTADDRTRMVKLYARS
jgi:hypothetical protein